jgi:hypothetical protein
LQPLAKEGGVVPGNRSEAIREIADDGFLLTGWQAQSQRPEPRISAEQAVDAFEDPWIIG